MSEAVLGMSGMNTPKKVLKARHIAGKITGNVNYTTPKPTIVQITDSATALETAYNNSRGKDEGMMTIYRAKLKAFRLLMVLVLAYIQQESGGDELIIESAGVATKKPKSPSQPVGKVTNVSGVQGALAGETILKWKALKYKKTYTIAKSADNIVWVDAKFPCTKKTVVITGLVPETYTWFKIAGINGLGQGEWSDPIRVESK
jgi:hypothetical protein